MVSSIFEVSNLIEKEAGLWLEDSKLPTKQRGLLLKHLDELISSPVAAPISKKEVLEYIQNFTLGDINLDLNSQQAAINKFLICKQIEIDETKQSYIDLRASINLCLLLKDSLLSTLDSRTTDLNQVQAKVEKRQAIAKQFIQTLQNTSEKCEELDEKLTAILEGGTEAPSLDKLLGVISKISSFANSALKAKTEHKTLTENQNVITGSKKTNIKNALNRLSKISTLLPSFKANANKTFIALGINQAKASKSDKAKKASKTQSKKTSKKTNEANKAAKTPYQFQNPRMQRNHEVFKDFFAKFLELKELLAEFDDVTKKDIRLILDQGEKAQTKARREELANSLKSKIDEYNTIAAEALTTSRSDLFLTGKIIKDNSDINFFKDFVSNLQDYTISKELAKIFAYSTKADIYTSFRNNSHAIKEKLRFKKLRGSKTAFTEILRKFQKIDSTIEAKHQKQLENKIENLNKATIIAGRNFCEKLKAAQETANTLRIKLATNLSGGNQIVKQLRGPTLQARVDNARKLKSELTSIKARKNNLSKSLATLHHYAQRFDCGSNITNLNEIFEKTIKNKAINNIIKMLDIIIEKKGEKGRARDKFLFPELGKIKSASANLENLSQQLASQAERIQAEQKAPEQKTPEPKVQEPEQKVPEQKTPEPKVQEPEQKAPEQKIPEPNVQEPEQKAPEQKIPEPNVQEPEQKAPEQKTIFEQQLPKGNLVQLMNNYMFNKYMGFTGDEDQ